MLNSYTNPTSLVIAGAWNPDVLSPKWVGKEVLGMQLGQDFPVTVQLPIGTPTQRPTYEFENIKYVASRTNLTFFLNPDDANQFEKSIRSAVTILSLLAHTPVTGFGFNFFFEIEEPSTTLLGTFSSGSMLIDIIEEPEVQIVVQNWKTLIKTKDYLLSLDTTLEGGKVLLNFNVHFEVTNAVHASECLKKENLFHNIKDKILSMANKLDNLGE